MGFLKMPTLPFSCSFSVVSLWQVFVLHMQIKLAAFSLPVCVLTQLTNLPIPTDEKKNAQNELNFPNALFRLFTTHSVGVFVFFFVFYRDSFFLSTLSIVVSL